jgi:hypothetical protein
MLPALNKGAMEKNRTTVNHKTSLKNTHRCQKNPTAKLNRWYIKDK